jgi:predicted nucleic acid-binding protein
VAGIVFDTNIYISRKPGKYPRNLLLSVVVLQELVAGAPDSSVVRMYEATRRKFENDGRLLAPTADDWFIAGRILNSLLRGLKSSHGGKIPKLPYQQQYQIIRDVLIARTVKRAGAVLVTDNVDDFAKIQRFCNLRMITGREFFK